MRIDVYLADSGLLLSRTEAKRFIDAGAVCVNGKTINKASYDVDGTEEITVNRALKEFVSRGGLKLKGALSEFKIDVSDRLCLDIGASSGGFTDCLLQSGARHVIRRLLGKASSSVLSNPSLKSDAPGLAKAV